MSTNTIPKYQYIHKYTLTTLKMDISLRNSNHLFLDKQVKISAHAIFIHNIFYFLFRMDSNMRVVLHVFPSPLFNSRKIENNLKGKIYFYSSDKTLMIRFKSY